jgi:gamma-glutamyltranspeptidase/glutathione hydrolase
VAKVGAEALERGGNAVDAVIASAFMAFVVEPQMCGLGGAGRLSVYDAKSQSFYAVDHNIRAPLASRAAMFELSENERSRYVGPGVRGNANAVGSLSIGTPGAVAGLCAAHERWASRPLEELVEPAIARSERGVPATPPIVGEIARQAEEIAKYPPLAERLLPGGRPLRPANQDQSADLLELPELGHSMREIARGGATAFYRGQLAEGIVDEVRRRGGILTSADLESYSPKIYRERPHQFGGFDYITCGDTVGYEVLGILARVNLEQLSPDGTHYRHLMAEALGCSFADGLAHPEVTGSFIDALLQGEVPSRRASLIDRRRALPRPIQPLCNETGTWEVDAAAAVGTGGARGTTFAVAMDGAGNAAALCTSLEGGFGSLVLVPDTGVILNNAMLDFDARPDQPNSISPGRMPFYGAPVYVAAKGGRAELALAGAGGYRIATAVLHGAVNRLHFGMPLQQALDSPRVHCQGEETLVDERIDRKVVVELQALGHSVRSLGDEPGLNAFGRAGGVARDSGGRGVVSGASPAWTTSSAAAQPGE